MSILHIDSLKEFQTLIQTEQTVIVDFFATWCGPCRMISPYFEELSIKYPSIKFVKIDVDQAPEICREYRIRSMPTFFKFINGSIDSSFTGASRDSLTKLVSN